MDFSRRRAAARGNVVAGSVWESRIRLDEVRGGIRVFNGDDGNAECGAPAAAVVVGSGGARRKTWKSDEGFNSILIAEEKPESPSSGDEQNNRKSPIPARRLRSNGSPIKPVQISSEKTERNSARKKTEQSRKTTIGITKPPTNGIGKNSPEKNLKEFNECKEKVISSAPPQDFFDAFEEEEEEEIEKESFDVKEINLPERKKIAEKTFPGNKQKLQTLSKNLPFFTTESQIPISNFISLKSLMFSSGFDNVERFFKIRPGFWSGKFGYNPLFFHQEHQHQVKKKKKEEKNPKSAIVEVKKKMGC